MTEVARELPWLESDEWLAAPGQGTNVSPISTPESGPSSSRSRGRPASDRLDSRRRGYPLVVLILLLAEIAWCGFLLSLGYRLLV